MTYRSCPREASAARSPACGGVATGFGLTGTTAVFLLTFPSPLATTKDETERGIGEAPTDAAV